MQECASSRLEVVKLLLDRGAQVDAKAREDCILSIWISRKNFLSADLK